MIWLVFGLMTLVAMAFIVLPLLRRRALPIERDAYSLEVYRHQLAELTSDVERGMLTEDEQTSARLEIERRMLALSPDREDSTKESAAVQPNPWPEIAALTIACAAGAFGIYLWLGAPEVPDQPFAARPQVDQKLAVQQPGDMSAAIKRLSERLAQDPDNLQGWMLLGQSYVSMRRYDDASDAFKRAATLDPASPDILLSLGESLVLGADGAVIPAAEVAFAKALSIDPGHIGARFYTAEGLAQKGHEKEAFDIWLKIVAETPADAPWLAALKQRLEVAAGKLDIDLAKVMPKPLPPLRDSQPAAPGPDQSDIAAARDMSPEDRAGLIRSMVERLAARLETDPNDGEGWQRLAQAYQVLGEDDKARQALARAEELAQASPAPGQAASQTQSGQGGPTQAEIAAAKDMSSDDRTAMIRSMVAKLAARLKNEPGDFAGWMKLARSYNVLKSPTEAEAAFRQALQLRPDDLDALMQLASSIVEASDRNKPLPDDAVKLFDHALKISPENPDALYFSGLAAAQSRNFEQARAHWNKLLKRLPPDSQAYTAVKGQLDGLAK